MRLRIAAGLGLLAAGIADCPAAGAEQVIKTLSALYGTSAAQRTCDATAVVGSACDGKKRCAVLASNALCGDPDFGTPKTLNLEYQCGPAIAKSVTAAEMTEAHLSCD